MHRRLMLPIGLIALLLVNGIANATPIQEQFDAANKSYENGDTDGAIEGYSLLLETYQQESPSIYYNLGNAYFDKGRFGMAIWSYERALHRQPTDTLRVPIESNLNLSRAEAKDALRKRGVERHHVFERQPLFWESFFGVIDRLVLTWIFAGAWALLFLIFLAGRWGYISFARAKHAMLPVGVVVCVTGFWVLAQLSGTTEPRGEGDESTGVVVTNTLLRGGLETDAETETIPEGLSVDILDDSHETYYRVSLFDGSEGWVLKSTIKEI